MAANDNMKIPDELIIAQSFQKSRQYRLSRECYQQWLNSNPHHYLRFKALFEVADNYFHEGLYLEATEAYNKFLAYCSDQSVVTEIEQGWVDAYTKLAFSRISRISSR